jgi:hypothetical protein
MAASGATSAQVTMSMWLGPWGGLLGLVADGGLSRLGARKTATYNTDNSLSHPRVGQIAQEARQNHKDPAMRLEDLTPNCFVVGLEPAAVVTIVAVVPIAGGAVQVIYKTPDGALRERLLGRADEANIAVATVERPCRQVKARSSRKVARPLKVVPIQWAVALVKARSLSRTYSSAPSR